MWWGRLGWGVVGWAGLSWGGVGWGGLRWGGVNCNCVDMGTVIFFVFKAFFSRKRTHHIFTSQRKKENKRQQWEQE